MALNWFRIGLIVSATTMAPGCEPVWAQTGLGALRVEVVDPEGAAVSGAQVRLAFRDRVLLTSATGAMGTAEFDRVKPGKYQVQVESKGFELQSISSLTIKPGSNQLRVQLEIARVREQVLVQQDKRERITDRQGSAFTTVLTEEQIAQLPDDPEEFEARLREMAGPGAVFRVNGFTGGKLPPKSQIREIRFHLDPFAAENHDATFIRIDITTKPGVDTWHGGLNLGFRDRVLNARNPFALVRGPEQFRRFSFDLGGPLRRNRTSLFLSADGSDSYESKTIVAALPQGDLFELARRPSRKLDLAARVEHVLTKTHTSRAEYQRNADREDNLGVGNFDLLERGYASNVAENLFRLSDSGAIGRSLVNEVRFQGRWFSSKIDSLSDAVTIQVLNAFTSGGAQLHDRRREYEVEFADNVDFGLGRNAMRAGFQLNGGSYRSSEIRNPNGAFAFADLDGYNRGTPLTFVQRVGAPTVNFSQYEMGWYWQDDLRVRKDLSMSFGLRYELETDVSDYNNLAPRLGLAWSPFKDGKTVIRASAGIFYNWLEAGTNEQTIRVDGKQEHDIVVLNPPFPNPFATGAAISLPPSRIQRDPNLQLPYIEQLSVGTQRELPRRITLMAYYFYQRGVHLFRARDINAPVPGLGRPVPTAGNIVQIEPSANSWRHSLSVNVNWNLARRLMFGANYTLSKTVDEADGPLGLPANNFDLDRERGPSLIDQRHRFFLIAYLSLLKGLKLGTTFRYGSGFPYNITTGFDNNGDSVVNDRPPGVGRNSARGTSQWEMNCRLGWGFSVGRAQDSSRHGNVTVVRSGDANPLGSMSSERAGRLRFELYVQAFNIFNHANLTNFSGVETSPFFGHATAAFPGRRLETGLRFGF